MHAAADSVMNQIPAEAPTRAPLRLAVIGAGPVGLALALHAARSLPQAQVSVFDARPLERDISGDPRTLALSLGSVQLLERLGAWDAEQAAPINEVQASQAPPTLRRPFGLDIGEPEVRISAQELGVVQLGAVLGYGQVLAPLQAAWLGLAGQQPQRLFSRFGATVSALKAVGAGQTAGVEVDAGIAETFDLAVVAEGGVFGEQTRKALSHDYRQTAWVGHVSLGTDSPQGVAFERFTRHGPVALLPLRSANSERRAALVWCVSADDDEVAELTDAQRLTVLQHLLPAQVGRITGISPLKHFALGLNAERTLVQGRTVRIGNAAQTLHPVAGQGMNLGLRDAFTLVQALRGDSDLDAALNSVEWQRAPDRWGTLLVTDFLARSFTWQWPGAPAARGLALAAVQAVPALKAALARQMMFGRR